MISHDELAYETWLPGVLSRNRYALWFKFAVCALFDEPPQCVWSDALAETACLHPGARDGTLIVCSQLNVSRTSLHSLLDPSM